MTDGAAPSPYSVVPLVAEHRKDWERLYAAYAEFYRSAQSAEMRERVWSWIADPAHELCGLIAVEAAGRGIGLAHYRPFARPLSASVGGFLDDLFVVPDWRGSGVADALLAAVVAEGRGRGWTLIRWITAEDNHRGRAFYERVAERTHWLTYQVPLV